jgi:hypothetical protein
MGTDREATEEELDSAERQVEELNVTEDFDNLAKEIYSVQDRGKNREATEVVEDAELLEEQLNVVKTM